MGKTLLTVGGIYNLLFVIFHLFFWRLFDWKNDLVSLTSINRAIMQVLNLCLMFSFTIFGTLSLFFPGQMAGTPLCIVSYLMVLLTGFIIGRRW